MQYSRCNLTIITGSLFLIVLFAIPSTLFALFAVYLHCSSLFKSELIIIPKSFSLLTTCNFCPNMLHSLLPLFLPSCITLHLSVFNFICHFFVQSTIISKVKTEYLRRVRRVLQSKLNGGNTIGAINTWAVSLVCYTAGIINWRKDELEAMDRKSRKMMTICNSLHPAADVDRLCTPRKHDGTGLISIQESIYMEGESLSRCIEDREEELLAAIRRENILNDWNGEDNQTAQAQVNARAQRKMDDETTSRKIP